MNNIVYFCTMQGHKEFKPRLFYELSLDGLVPEDNFYRKVNRHLELGFLYPETKKYYGTEGQQSIDPVVFFKILLVGYLNNINSDSYLLMMRTTLSPELAPAQQVAKTVLFLLK